MRIPSSVGSEKAFEDALSGRGGGSRILDFLRGQANTLATNWSYIDLRVVKITMKCALTFTHGGKMLIAAD